MRLLFRYKNDLRSLLAPFVMQVTQPVVIWLLINLSMGLSALCRWLCSHKQEGWPARVNAILVGNVGVGKSSLIKVGTMPIAH